MTMDLETYQSHGLHEEWGDITRTVNGRSNIEILNALATPGDVQYHPCAEAYPNETSPHGTVTHWRDWRDSDVYAQTQRDIWVYVPAQFDQGACPPALMVFNDRGGNLDAKGPIRATRGLD